MILDRALLPALNRSFNVSTVLTHRLQHTFLKIQKDTLKIQKDTVYNIHRE